MITGDAPLLFIEPCGQRSAEPVLDELTERMAEALRVGEMSNCYMGVHTCVCGVRSESHDVLVQRVDGDYFVTNTLATHYLMWHRDDVPESELVKVRTLA